MPEIWGNLVKVGVGISNLSRTAVAAQILAAGWDLDLVPRKDVVFGGVGAGTFGARFGLIARAWAEGRFSCEVSPNAFGYVLHALGYPPTTTGASAPFTHTFTYGSGTASRWLSVNLSYAADVQETYGGCGASRLTLSWDGARGEVLTAELDLLSGRYLLWSGQESTVIPTGIGIDAAEPFVSPLAIVEKPSGTSFVRCLSGNVEFRMDRELQYTTRGTVFPREHRPIRNLEVSGRLVVTFESRDDLLEFLNQIGAASFPVEHRDLPTAPTTSLRIRWAPASNAQLEIHLPRVVFTELGRTVRASDHIEQDFAFTALFDTASAYIAQIRLVNTTSSYPVGTAIGGSY